MKTLIACLLLFVMSFPTRGFSDCSPERELAGSPARRLWEKLGRPTNPMGIPIETDLASRIYPLGRVKGENLMRLLLQGLGDGGWCDKASVIKVLSLLGTPELSIGRTPDQCVMRAEFLPGFVADLLASMNTSNRPGELNQWLDKKIAEYHRMARLSLATLPSQFADLARERDADPHWFDRSHSPQAFYDKGVIYYVSKVGDLRYVDTTTGRIYNWGSGYPMVKQLRPQVPVPTEEQRNDWKLMAAEYDIWR